MCEKRKKRGEITPPPLDIPNVRRLLIRNLPHKQLSSALIEGKETPLSPPR